MGMLRGLRLAARQIARNPSFSATVVLTLALGIGASTLIYSVIDGVLLKPLPYPEADRIVRVFQVNANGYDRVNLSGPNFEDLKAQTHSFAALAVFQTITEPVVGGSEAARLAVTQVSREFYDVIGARPLLGRAFVTDEQTPGGPPAVLISYRFWQRYLGGTADFASRTLRVGDRVSAIVGVMPPDFVMPPGVDNPDGADVWASLEVDPPNPYRLAHNYRAIGRLASGVSLEQARADLTAVAHSLKQQYGEDTWMEDAALVPLQDYIVGDARPALLVLGAAVILLFLVACANVSSMLLAHAIAREQETAVRVALGAGAWRLAGQFFCEALLLCAAGGALGIGLACWGLEALSALHAGTLPRADVVRIDWRSVSFATGLIVVTAAIWSSLLAARATREGSGASAKSRTVGGRRSVARDLLVAAQTAMAAVLLIGAVLLMRSYVQLTAVDPGFRSDDVLLMNIALPIPGKDADTSRIGRFHEALIERARGLPGITAVGGVTAAPLTGGAGNGVFLDLRRPDEIKTFDDFNVLWKGDPERTGYAEYRVASEGYFAALDIPLLRGRLFGRGDGPGAEHVAVISRSLAERKWPGEDPLGKLVQFGNMDGDLTPFRVVGIVGDVRDFGLDAEPRATLYGYYAQRTRAIAWSFWIAIRAPNAERLIPAAREIVRGLDPDVVPAFRTVAQLESTSIAPRRFNLVMVGVFGATALLLALAGIYGAVAFNVAQRTREIGVRIALGAQTRGVIAIVLRKSVVWVAGGIGAGLVIALGASRAVSSLLYGISPQDPLAYAAAAGVLLIAAVFAAWIPALRAARVDPVVALRSE
jgi:putative ABC transport system permease protein